jgi:drug/metabolite transporter (DMT)-like permease
VTRRGWTLFLLMSVLWGVPYLLIKVAVDDLGPAWVAFGRVVIALAILVPLAHRRGALGCLRGRWAGLALVGALEVAAPFLLISAGEEHISSSLTGLLIASEPLLVAILALRLDVTERVNRAACSASSWGSPASARCSAWTSAATGWRFSARGWCSPRRPATRPASSS